MRFLFKMVNIVVINFTLFFTAFSANATGDIRAMQTATRLILKENSTEVRPSYFACVVVKSDTSPTLKK